MTLGEAARLLGVCTMYDYRKTDENHDNFWHKALGDLDFDDAVEAVVRHYANSTEFIKPAHIRQGVKAIREERRRNEPHEVRALPSRFEADMGRQVRMSKGMASSRQVLGTLLNHLARQSQPALPSALQELRAITSGADEVLEGVIVEEEAP